MDIMNYKVETWHTLSEYKKKYRHGSHKLTELTRSEINEFDRKNNVNTENYLLQGKKWWLINGIYYEVPTAPSWTWFRNLNGGIKVATCALITGALASAIIVPVVMARNKGSDKPEEESRNVVIDGFFKDIKCETKMIDGNISIKLTSTDPTFIITDIESIEINENKLTKSEYSFDHDTSTILIKKDVLSKYRGDIKVTPNVEQDIKFEDFLVFTPINDNECNVMCKNNYVDIPKILKIPSTRTIVGKSYTVTEICDYGFHGINFKNDAEIIFPSTILKVGNYAFAESKNIKKIELNDGLLGIGVCSMPSTINEIRIPSSLDYSGCRIAFLTSSIHDVYLDNQNFVNAEDDDGNDGTCLMKYAQNIYIKNNLNDPPNNSYIIKEKFTKDTNYKNQDYTKWNVKDSDSFIYNTVGTSSSVKISKHILDGKDVVVPDKDPEGNDVTTIDQYFIDGVTINSLTFPDTITSVSGWFCNNASFKTIKLPSTFKPEFIGDSGYKFYNCYDLKTVILDSQDVVDCLDSCQGLFEHPNKIYIKDTLTDPGVNSYIVNNGFTKSATSNLEGYIEWVLSEKYKFIDKASGECTIKGYSSQTYDKDLTLPSTDGESNIVTKIASNGFSRNKSLEKVTLPSTIKVVSDNAFDSTTIKNIELNEGLTNLNNGVFQNCTKLEEINIPSTLSLPTRYAYAWYNCDNLHTVVLDNQNYIDASDYCEFLYYYATTIYIKDTLTQPSTAGQYIFDNFIKQDSSDRPNYYKWTRNIKI